MAMSDEDLSEIREMIREEIAAAFAALFVAARIQNFAKVLTPEIEARVKEILASIECNQKD